MNKKEFSSIGLRYFIGSILIIAIQAIALLIFKQLTKEQGDLYNTNNVFLLQMLSAYILAAPLFMLLVKKHPACETRPKRSMSVGKFISFFCMTSATMFLGNLIGQILTGIISTFKTSPVENVLPTLVGDINPWINLIIIVLAAPVIEELLFRKLLIDRVSKYGDKLAILLSGLLFGLYHGNLNQFAYAFFLGCIFAYVYIKTRNVIYTILLHIGVNFCFSFLPMFLLSESGMTQLSDPSFIADTANFTSFMEQHIGGIFGYFFFILAQFVIIVAGIILLLVNKKKIVLEAGSEPLAKGTVFKTVFLNPGMLLFCILWIATIIIQLFS